MDDIVFCSFFTDDDYYREKKDNLIKHLDNLNIDHEIREINVPAGMNWADICRKKVSFFSDICDQCPEKKVFWIDVDCSIDRLPDYVKRFSADIIGFSRGFSDPTRMGYHLRSRFWEPCFIGVNSTPAGRQFIKDAVSFEKDYSGSATDDYFFEESWRINCHQVSFQIIPSIERKTNNSQEGFFIFGASGNVADFKDKVAQHSKILFKPSIPFSRYILSKAGLLPILKKTNRVLSKLRGVKRNKMKPSIPSSLTDKNFKMKALSLAIRNDVHGLEKLRASQSSTMTEQRRNALLQANAISEYQSITNSNFCWPLCWWFNPAPGNLGDWLSPYIISAVTKQNVRLVTPTKMASTTTPNLVSVGSIAKFANQYSIVLGAGISRRETAMNVEARYLSLRGPLTGKVLEHCGGKDPGVYGDPAIIMPRLYRRTYNPSEATLLVRHSSHASAELLLPTVMEELSILAASKDEIESFINKIHGYKYVVTSAMHCYILCQAYGIPSALVSFSGYEDRVAGDGMKYSDYALGVGLDLVMPKVLPLDLRSYDFDKIVRQIKISDLVIDDLHAHIKKSLANCRPMISGA